MNFGGPVWHASVSLLTSKRLPSVQESFARMELAGVGDAALGEWLEMPGTVLHLRRRLTHAEAAIVGPMCDVRGTPEHDRLARKVLRWQHPSIPKDFAWR
jgi:hypothetical protein